MNQVEIGAYIAQERIKQGMTHYRLSKISGITQRHLKMIENGKYDVRVSTLQIILKALNKKLLIQ